MCDLLRKPAKLFIYLSGFICPWISNLGKLVENHCVFSITVKHKSEGTWFHLKWETALFQLIRCSLVWYTYLDFSKAHFKKVYGCVCICSEDGFHRNTVWNRKTEMLRYIFKASLKVNPSELNSLSQVHSFSFVFVFIFWWYWGLDSGFCTELHPQPF